jgi:hypothetical protein
MSIEPEALAGIGAVESVLCDEERETAAVVEALALRHIEHEGLQALLHDLWSGASLTQRSGSRGGRGGRGGGGEG